MDLANLSKFPFSDIETFAVRTLALVSLLSVVCKVLKHELPHDKIKSWIGRVQAQHVLIALNIIQTLIGFMLLRR